MSSELSQTTNDENDQITVHKPGTGNIKDQVYTKEEIQSKRKERIVNKLSKQI